MPFFPDLSKHTVEPHVAAHERKQLTWFLVACLFLLIGTATAELILSFQGKASIPPAHNPLINATPTPTTPFLPTPTSFLATVPTTNWKTYTNQTLGYRILYPNGWNVEEFSPTQFYLRHGFTQDQLFTKPKDPNAIADISISETDALRTDSLQNTAKRWRGGKQLPSIINAHPAIIVETSHEEDFEHSILDGSTEISIFVKNDDNQTLMIQLEAVAINNFRPIFNTLLSSFTFIKPTPTLPFTQKPQNVCTQEAKLCPDGKTYVSRTGPNCAFATCPSPSDK